MTYPDDNPSMWAEIEHRTHGHGDAQTMTAAEAKADHDNNTPTDGHHGCYNCGRSRAMCRTSNCGATLNCETCGHPLPDPITYTRCDDCRGIT